MKNRDFLLLILGAIFFFFAVSFALQMPANALIEQYVNEDPVSYWDAAKMIFSEGGKPHPIRPFFYPFLIGLSSLFSASKSIAWVWALGLNFIFWLSTVVFVFMILNDNTNRKIAIFGASIFALNISNILLVWTVLAESLLKYWENKEKTGIFIAFLTFFCLLTLTRPTFYPLLSFLIPLFLWSVYKRYLSLFIAAISVIIFISTIGFSVYKMKENYGNWTLSYIGDCALYTYFCAYSKVVSPEKSLEQTGKDWQQEWHDRNYQTARYNDSIPWSALPPLAFNDLIDQLKNNKRGLIFTFFRDLFSNSTAPSIYILPLENVKKSSFFAPTRTMAFWLSRLQNVLNSLMALLMPFVFLRIKSHLLQLNKPIYYIFGVNCFLNLYAVLISTVTFSTGDRFHLVVVPLNIINLGIIYFYKNDYKSLIIKELDPSV
jgi:hypothetical protein